MLHYSQEVVNNLEASRSHDKGQCQWNWAFFKDSLLSQHMGIIGSSYRVVSDKIVFKSSVMNVGNWVISGVNA